MLTKHPQLQYHGTIQLRKIVLGNKTNKQTSKIKIQQTLHSMANMLMHLNICLVYQIQAGDFADYFCELAIFLLAGKMLFLWLLDCHI